MIQKSIKAVVVVAAVTASFAASAAGAGIDTTAVTSGITDAQTAILAVIGSLTALSVAIFGVAKVYGFIKRKAGA